VRYQLGFDIGGTFTDFALFDTANGKLEIFKLAARASVCATRESGWLSENE
jgi:N-methylhydantoinase A/oxoprolinase/acetone carboxylase beta subunit